MRLFDEKDTIRRLSPFDPTDFPHRLAYYDRMARQGWILSGRQNIFRLGEVFGRGDGYGVRFDIDYRNGLKEATPEYEAYASQNRGKGYTLLYHLDKMYVFRRSAATPPMHTPQTLEKALSDAENPKKKRRSRRMDTPYLVMTVIACAGVLLFLVVSLLLGYPRMMISLPFCILALMSCVTAISFVKYRRIRRMREALRKGDAFDATDYGPVLRLRRLEILVLLVLLGVYILQMVAEFR